jgi:hypothetical protein
MVAVSRSAVGAERLALPRNDDQAYAAANNQWLVKKGVPPRKRFDRELLRALQDRMARLGISGL